MFIGTSSSVFYDCIHEKKKKEKKKKKQIMIGDQI